MSKSPKAKNVIVPDASNLICLANIDYSTRKHKPGTENVDPFGQRSEDFHDPDVSNEDRLYRYEDAYEEMGLDESDIGYIGTADETGVKMIDEKAKADAYDVLEIISRISAMMFPNVDLLDACKQTVEMFWMDPDKMFFVPGNPVDRKLALMAAKEAMTGMKDENDIITYLEEGFPKSVDPKDKWRGYHKPAPPAVPDLID